MREKIFVVIMETPEGKEFYSLNKTKEGAEKELTRAELARPNTFIYIDEYFLGE